MAGKPACWGRSAAVRLTLSTARPRLEELEARVVLTLPVPDHVVVVMEENHAYSQIIGSSQAPYVNSLAQQGALFTQSFAIEHPSQPNYLDFFSGRNQGITSDACPIGPFTTANLGSELIAAGRTYASYSEELPSVGSTVCTSGEYARKHNPTPDFSNVPSADNLPFTAFPSDYTQLPTYSFIDPNLLDDMHSGTIAQGDTWLGTNLSNYATWAQTHNSLLIVTWDEDDSAHGNQIATIFVGPMVQPGQYSEHINHYNILRTVEDMYGLPYAGNSGSVNPITDVWRNVATVDHFAVTTDAANPDVAGSPFDVSVTAQDVNGNTVTNYTGTVTFSSADPYGASLPADYTFQPGDQGSVTFYGATALYTAGTWDVTATDTGNGAAGAAYVSVQAAPAVSLAVIAPGTASSGAAFDVTVVAQDPYGNTDTNYGGTVSWATTDPDPGVTLPADYTFQPSDQGQVYYPGGVTLITLGDQFLVAYDTNNNSIAGSADVFVTNSAATNRGPAPVSLGTLGQTPVVPARIEPAPANPGNSGADGVLTPTGTAREWVAAPQKSAAAFKVPLMPNHDGVSPWEILTDPLSV